MGLLRPINGEIYIDGCLLDEKNYDSWMKNIAHVSQSVFLTDASYKENIAFGEDQEDIDVKKLKDSAKSAHIHEFIENQSHKYETEVGELGKRISGGQKQRIGIARALYKSNNLLVLDESTSSLDNLTEEKILESIDNLDNDKTIFMIAHRITTLRHMDRILELKDGRIVNELTFQELIER